MRLIRLTLVGFRNLGDRALDLPPEGVAIVGPNAQGKTNLLEAIHYLETFRSFRGTRDDQLIRFGEGWFRLTGELQAASDREPDPGTGGVPARTVDRRIVTAAYEAGTGKKKVTVDGEVPVSIGSAIGRVGSVLFTPEDVRLVSDGPAGRRRFLDIVLSLNRPGYLGSLQRFRQALNQRNAALRQSGGGSAVSAWDRQVIRAGAEVSWTRSEWTAGAAPSFSEHCGHISGRAARLRYVPSIPRASLLGALREVEEAYGAALAGSRAQEMRLRTTVVGPHRDEMRFFTETPEGERDVREFGSGGERRTVALALRLLEAETVQRCRERDAILLLDDVFAELDEDRSRRVLALLDRMVPGQVILTAPKAGDVRFRSDLLPRWSIQDGEVEPR